MLMSSGCWGLWACAIAVLLATITVWSFNVFDWLSLRKMLRRHEENLRQIREEMHRDLQAWMSVRNEAYQERKEGE